MDITSITFPKNRKAPINTVPHAPCFYTPFNFGVDEDLYALGGKNVKVAVVGTGSPVHKDLSDSTVSEVAVGGIDGDDIHGYSTMISGILCGHGEILGMVPDIELLSIRAVDNSGKTDYKMLTASVLLATVKRADVVILPPISDHMNETLKNAIDKAYKMNIIMLSCVENKMSDFCDSNPEVFFLKPPYKRKKVFYNIKRSDNRVDLKTLSRNAYTTFLNNQYIAPPSCIEAMGVLAGVISIYLPEIQQKKYTPYDALDYIIKHSK